VEQGQSRAYAERLENRVLSVGWQEFLMARACWVLSQSSCFRRLKEKDDVPEYIILVPAHGCNVNRMQ
jgi:hypothetical protein